MLVKVSELEACNNEAEIDRKIDQILSECRRNDPPFLSDLIVGIGNGAQPLMIALGDLEVNERDVNDDQRLRWKIQVLCDEWGNKPQPGDIVTRKVQKIKGGLYKKDGKPVTGIEINRSKIDGSFDRKFVKRIEFKVDKKGCIECGFESAVYFLNNYGVHAKTNYGMPHGKPQTNEKFVNKGRPEVGGLSSAPNGQKIHVWYWRYKEMDAADYKALPNLTTTTDPKRGHAEA